jgi:hypothetical protein
MVAPKSNWVYLGQGNSRNAAYVDNRAELTNNLD